MSGQEWTWLNEWMALHGVAYEAQDCKYTSFNESLVYACVKRKKTMYLGLLTHSQEDCVQRLRALREDYVLRTTRAS